MGRLGPLTSQALGRSPYDDVVGGTGEGDPHEPDRQYDDKGRIINPETKQRIKNVIRAHNEVMLVIGVAEPDNTTESPEVVMAQEHQAYESEIGRTLLHIGRSLGILGIWGVHGVRQRIMLYRPYSHVEFIRLLQYERKHRSFTELTLMGLPSFAVMQGIHWTRLSVNWVLEKPWLRAALGWCQFHLHLFLTMQKLGLIPGSAWFPGPRFFIPCTESSPIPALPPIEVFNATTVGGCIKSLAMNVAPYVAFFLCGRIWNLVYINIWPHVHARLPRPARSDHYSSRPLPSIERRPTLTEDTWHTVPESPTLGAADREIRHGRTPGQDIPTLQALEGQTAEEIGIPLGAIRRQSTFSSRGGDQDYGTDEEDAEMVNPTLISFDVDTSEPNEQPAGVWSAELRPSFGGDARPATAEQPVYMVNPLTSLPAVLATDILTNFIAYVVCAPFDTMAIRAAARAFAHRRGLPTTEMYRVGLLDGLCWRNIGNIAGIEILRLLISGELWATMSIISQLLHVTEDEWKDFRMKEEQEEKEREQRDRAASLLARMEEAVETLEEIQDQIQGDLPNR